MVAIGVRVHLRNTRSIWCAVVSHLPLSRSGDRRIPYSHFGAHCCILSGSHLICRCHIDTVLWAEILKYKSKSPLRYTMRIIFLPHRWLSSQQALRNTRSIWSALVSHLPLLHSGDRRIPYSHFGAHCCILSGSHLICHCHIDTSPVLWAEFLKYK